MSNPIELQTAQFPYLIREEGAPIESVLTMERERRGFDGHPTERTLFYVANPRLEISSDRLAGRSYIQVLHTFATDDEDDRAKIALLNLESVELVYSSGRSMHFKGWLTAAPQFYPEEITDPEVNPFIGAKRKSGKTEWGYSKNTGYPYTPPKVVIPGFTTPMMVEFDITWGESAWHEKWLKSAMRDHAKARRERQAAAREAAKERAAQRKKNQASDAAKREWLLTDEGKEFTALDAELRAITNGEERRLWTAKTTPGKRWSELHGIMFNVGYAAYKSA